MVQFMLLMKALNHQQKSLVLILQNQTKLCLNLHYNAGNSHLLVDGKEIFKFKADYKNVNFPTKFCLWSISNGLSATECREVSLNGNVDDFSVNYNSIDKSGMLNIHKYKIMFSPFILLLSFNESLPIKYVFKRLIMHC